MWLALMFAGGCGSANCDLDVVHTLQVIVPDPTMPFTLDFGGEVDLSIACPEADIDSGGEYVAICSSTGVTLSGAELDEVLVSLDGGPEMELDTVFRSQTTTCAEPATQRQLDLSD